jgi:DNA-binding transcriptional ArsR family regulator
MILKKIFGSGARVKLFQQFLLNPTEEFYIRELTRILDEQINSLRRELENLQNLGILKSREKNRKKYYRINPHFSFLSELTSIIRKTSVANEAFLKDITKLGAIDVLVLSGVFIEKNTDVDIFMVGDIPKEVLSAFITDRFPNQDLTFNVMNKEDFLYRITLKDKFVQNVFQERENLILKNKLKKDTEHLIS